MEKKQFITNRFKTILQETFEDKSNQMLEKIEKYKLKLEKQKLKFKESKLKEAEVVEQNENNLYVFHICGLVILFFIVRSLQLWKTFLSRENKNARATEVMTVRRMIRHRLSGNNKFQQLSKSESKIKISIYESKD